MGTPPLHTHLQSLVLHIQLLLYDKTTVLYGTRIVTTAPVISLYIYINMYW